MSLSFMFCLNNEMFCVYPLYNIGDEKKYLTIGEKFHSYGEIFPFISGFRGPLLIHEIP